MLGRLLDNAIGSGRVSLSEDEWVALLARVRQHRIIGLLNATIPHLSIVTPCQLVQLKKHDADAMAWCLRVEVTYGRVAALLDADRVDYRVLKGVATARILYPEPGLREFGDLDILVRPADFERALAALRPLAAQAIPRYGPATAQVDKGETLIDQTGVEIDVHHTVKGWLYSSRVSGDLLFADPQAVSIAGRTAFALSEPAMLVQAALHMTTGGWRLSTAADLSILVGRVQPHDPQFVALLSQRGVARAVWAGVARTGSWVPLPEPWLDALAANRLDPLTRRIRGWLLASPRRQSAAAFVAAPHRTHRAAELIWPEQAWLDYRDLSHRQHLRQLVRSSGTPIQP